MDSAASNNTGGAKRLMNCKRTIVQSLIMLVTAMFSILILYCALWTFVSFPLRLTRQLPKLLIVSFDGFRWDYLSGINASLPNFSWLLANGVHATRGLTNTFVTITAPNHYGLVTGVYEETHGVVGNNFYDPETKQFFSYFVTKNKTDPRLFETGTPIWQLNVGSGRQTGCFGWVGCDVAIHGRPKPHHWTSFHGTVPFFERVNTVVGWFKDAKEPINLGLLYIEEPDETGHKFGPHSSEVRSVVERLDAVAGYLIWSLEREGLADEVNVIFTSDHGMATAPGHNYINASAYANISALIDVNQTSFVGAYWNVKVNEALVFLREPIMDSAASNNTGGAKRLMNCKRTIVQSLIMLVTAMFSILILYCALWTFVSFPLRLTRQLPKLLIVSFDGFRWDYLSGINASLPNFSWLLANGVHATRGLTNTFVTITAPNHYGLVTGVYEETHGVVGNNFYDPETKQFFSYFVTKNKTDPRLFETGTPIWQLNVGSGRQTGCFGWVGCDVAIHGRPKPHHWTSFHGTVPFFERVNTVVGWFKDAKEPINLGLLYIEEPDETGHKFGPHSSEVRSVVERLDAVAGYLIWSLEREGLADEVNVIFTSDHGMATAPGHNYINASAYANISALIDVNQTSFVGAYWNVKVNEVYGSHGYDPRLPEMHPYFIGIGPAFKSGYQVPTFLNLDVYPLMAYILGVSPQPNNGSFERVKSLLADEGRLWSKLEAGSRRSDSHRCVILLLFGLPFTVIVLLLWAILTVYRRVKPHKGLKADTISVVSVSRDTALLLKT